METKQKLNRVGNARKKVHVSMLGKEVGIIRKKEEKTKLFLVCVDTECLYRDVHMLHQANCTQSTS